MAEFENGAATNGHNNIIRLSVPILSLGVVGSGHKYSGNVQLALIYIRLLSTSIRYIHYITTKAFIKTH
jgi:hypothetical protein